MVTPVMRFSSGIGFITPPVKTPWLEFTLTPYIPVNTEKKIRRDFYYRIKNISINTSPLRNHPEDIPDIIKAYEEKRNISEGRIKDDYNKLMGYKWNGNVRELYHFLDRIYAEEQRTLESERH